MLKFIEKIIKNSQPFYSICIEPKTSGISSLLEKMPFEDYAHLILDSLDYTGGFLVYKDGSLVKHHGIASRLKATVDLSNQDNIDAIKKRGMVHAYLDGNMLMVYNSNRIMNNEEFSRVADNILKTSNK